MKHLVRHMAECGGMILCRKPFAQAIDKSVFPGLQGGPHMNVIAGIAITLGKAQRPEFKDYAEQVLRNAATLARVLLDNGVQLVTGGTDNHMMVVDTVASFGFDGTVAERALDNSVLWRRIASVNHITPGRDLLRI